MGVHVFAEIDPSTSHVLRVLAVSEEDAADEAVGEAVCQSHTGSTNQWVAGRTDSLLRKNQPGIGMLYDESRDAFREEEGPYPSWVLDEDTCWWEAPTPMPDNGNLHDWDDDTTSWVDLDVPIPSS